MPLAPDELAFLALVEDRCRWAETFLKHPRDPARPLRLRKYQRKALTDTSRRQAWRWGRRTGKSCGLAIRALHYAFSRPNKKVLIVAPYEAQIKALFDEAIRPMMRDAALLSESVAFDRSQPFEIMFKNGSSILGMTAGVRAGQHGSGVRGQNADLLILDEADYLTPKTIAAIQAILATNAEVDLIASSTPTGKHEWFHQVCTDRRLGYSEHHVRSSESPEWTPEVEAEFRRTMTAEDYEHEYEAGWGSQAFGVFRPVDIEASLRDYRYDDVPVTKKPGNIRILGVDWNTAKHGVQLIITELLREPVSFPRATPDGRVESHPLRGVFVVTQHVSITSKDFTQNKAIQAIFTLMAEYQVDYVYVDEGYGATNIEDLILHSEKYPQLQLKSKLRTRNMSSVITIRDPQTSLPVEKPVKPYMVHHAQLRMEEGVCLVPLHEDYPTGLVGQMRAYVVVRLSDKGYPTFSTANDHALDAWMLSMLGFAEEFSELKELNPNTAMRYVSPERMWVRESALPTREWGDRERASAHPAPSEVMQRAVSAAGLESTYTYAGATGGKFGGPPLHDDSDEALAYRQKVTRQVSRPSVPWATRSPRKRSGPVRTNITKSKSVTPWDD